MIRAAFFVFALLLSHSIHAQLSGVVKDESGEGIPGATITFEGTNVGTVADINGGFSFKSVPQNSKALIIACVGFKEKRSV